MPVSPTDDAEAGPAYVVRDLVTEAGSAPDSAAPDVSSARPARAPRARDGVLTVPVIDLAVWREGDEAARADLARAVDRAAREVGFMQVVGHGVPTEVEAAFTAAADAFFALPWPPSPVRG